ncbi:hypothetical protein CAS74_002077 [Pichia kudriavzevii]|uniref:Transcription regulator Rua1 C-terminal domain-containing protein n=1 Tax=Pichia kudriavzevii TaxID=4909 RepID=A0A1Z8JP68_PICKU|nr:hypothetical protein CAS74_002077 [Pichia kudriavzevii]
MNPLELSGIPTSFKPPPVPYFLCEYCQKISDTCYFCLNQTSNFERKLYQFQLYNEPNNLPIEEVVKHCDKSFIYEENIDNADKIYEPYITRCKVEDEYDVEGKRKKKDHPGFCKYCIIEGAQWDSNFYERNNSRYRGHMINTHGIHPNGTQDKLINNKDNNTNFNNANSDHNNDYNNHNTDETKINCNKVYELLKELKKYHSEIQCLQTENLMAEPNQLNNRLDHLKATLLHENTERIDLPEQLFEKNQFIVKLSNETNDFKKVIIDKKHKTDAFPEQI